MHTKPSVVIKNLKGASGDGDGKQGEEIQKILLKFYWMSVLYMKMKIGENSIHVVARCLWCSTLIIV